METLNLILRPLTVQELELLTVNLLDFFSPMANRAMRELLSLPVNNKVMQPLSIFNFTQYIEKKGILTNALAYHKHISVLIRKLVNEGLLTHAGSSTGSPMFNECYYSLVVHSELQRSGDYWLSSIIGERYLRSLLERFIVRIEGENSDGIPGTGSGVLISSDTILTCAHNIDDIDIASCWIGDKELSIVEQLTHPKYDIGIIRINPIYDSESYPYFGPPMVLDKTLTLGYPPLRGIREPLLLAQTGEINAIGSQTFTGCECLTISSVTRPGNSGGPVFSLQGYIVGIVIQQAYATASFSVQEKDSGKAPLDSPFYLAISSNTIRDAIAEIDSDISIRFENFNR
ncbi:MAG: trypsin-like peptidase domain-containing protein [Clostridia bacterium]|nr:trypsin-like peptidase domain-containing protein [Clostridia bacterium]